MVMLTQNPPAVSPFDLRAVMDSVLRRAAHQGSISAHEVRAELAAAGAEPARWKEVVEQARSHLLLRNRRYHYISSVSPHRERETRRVQVIHEAVHQLVGQYRLVVAEQERREVDRVNFLQPVTIQTADLVDHRVLTRDISPSGIRLLGSRSLLGQKVRMTIPAPNGDPYVFVVRIMWTQLVGDELYENGGAFVERVK